MGKSKNELKALLEEQIKAWAANPLYSAWGFDKITDAIQTWTEAQLRQQEDFANITGAILLALHPDKIGKDNVLNGFLLKGSISPSDYVKFAKNLRKPEVEETIVHDIGDVTYEDLVIIADIYRNIDTLDQFDKIINAVNDLYEVSDRARALLQSYPNDPLLEANVHYADEVLALVGKKFTFNQIEAINGEKANVVYLKSRHDCEDAKARLDQILEAYKIFFSLDDNDPHYVTMENRCKDVAREITQKQDHLRTVNVPIRPSQLPEDKKGKFSKPVPEVKKSPGASSKTMAAKKIEAVNSPPAPKVKDLRAKFGKAGGFKRKV